MDFRGEGGKMGKIPNLIIIIVIAVTTFFISVRSVEPMLKELARVKTINLATEIINAEAANVLRKAWICEPLKRPSETQTPGEYLV